MRSLSRTFAIQSLSDFAAGLPDEPLLCPVGAVSEYVARMSRFVNRPRRLFVSSCSSSRAMSITVMVFLTYCERLLCTLEPAPMMLLPLMPIVFVALRLLLPFFRIVFLHVSAFIHVMRRLTIVEDSGMALTWWVNFNS